jgi:hypothetical protein
MKTRRQRVAVAKMAFDSCGSNWCLTAMIDNGKVVAVTYEEGVRALDNTTGGGGRQREASGCQKTLQEVEEQTMQDERVADDVRQWGGGGHGARRLGGQRHNEKRGAKDTTRDDRARDNTKRGGSGRCKALGQGGTRQ